MLLPAATPGAPKDGRGATCFGWRGESLSGWGCLTACLVQAFPAPRGSKPCTWSRRTKSPAGEGQGSIASPGCSWETTQATLIPRMVLSRLVGPTCCILTTAILSGLVGARAIAGASCRSEGLNLGSPAPRPFSAHLHYSLWPQASL